VSFAARRALVLERIANACARVGRDAASVQLLAVSKTRLASEVDEAVCAGQVAFGENRVQELAAKAIAADARTEWHLIGSLQTNKVRQLLGVPRLALVHSVDRAAVADALEARLAEQNRSLDVLVQVEATGEPAKRGVGLGALAELAEHVVRECRHLRLRGLMGIGPLAGNPLPVFRAIAAARHALEDRLGLALPVLSTGMSDDLEPAIEAGSTLVRVGTALFGPRG
jgi:pyridoxal phosphate enzyme (YggS family)